MRKERKTEVMKPLTGSVTLVSTALFALSCSSEPPANAEADENCEDRADAYYAGINKSSDDAAIRVEIASADPAPPTIAGKNVWTIHLTKDGTPIDGATIVGLTFMRDHGHPGSSALSTDLGGGTYELGPFQLRMPGLWEITLKITPKNEPERAIVFNFCLPKN
jgi:hypothetical protein